MQFQRSVAAVSVGILIGACVSVANAQSWPSKPIKVIIPFGAGSATDVVPRVAFESVSQALGQPITVENRPGAGATTGTAQVAKSDPDGYTWLATSSAYTIAPAMFEKLPYDADKDLIGVALIAGLSSVMIVPASLPYNTVQEFVGAGSGSHLAAERFRMSAGIEAAHVAFKSGAEALTEIVAGRIEFDMCPVGTALVLIKEGKVKALAVTPRARVAALPDLPTTLEAGYRDCDSTAWVGLFALAATPKPILDRMHKETAAALASDAVKARFQAIGVETVAIGADAFNRQITEEIAMYKQIVKKLAIKAN